MASTASTTTAGHAPEGTRRDFLFIATATVGAVGAAAALVPLIDQMNPDASTLAAGGPVDLDGSKIEEGAQGRIYWREGAGRLFLSLPWLQIRRRRPGLFRRAGAVQSAGAALSLHQRHHDPGRRESNRLGVEFRRHPPALSRHRPRY